MQLVSLIATGATVLASLRTVQGHAYVVDPKAYFPQGYASNGYGSTINNTKWAEFDGATTNNYSQSNPVFFQRAFKSTKEKSLGTFIARYQELYSNEIDAECGLTAYKESERSKMPATAIIYTGFTHPGPCEMRCDDTLLLFEEDCQKTYPEIPAKIPYDISLCANANRFTIYWIAVQSNPWQVYIHCVWLEGGSGRGKAPLSAGKGSSTPTTNTAPSTSDASQKADEEPPAAKSDASTPDASTPDASTPAAPTPAAPTPAAPTPEASTPEASTPEASTTKTPTVSTSTTNAKCNRRRRRN